jgi:uncharacterized protein YndB with AHSA1/START domain
MKAPDGNVMWGKFVYRKIVPPSKIVFINSFSDENRGITRHSLHSTWPLQMLATFLFEDAGPGKTRFNLLWTPYDATEEEQKTFHAGDQSMTQGWGGTLDQLAAYLANAQKGQP